jgi:predicted ArsR family transcriptional regulator
MSTTQLVPVVLPALKECKQATASDLDVPKVALNALVDAGLLRVVGSRKNMDENGTALRGRPAHVFALTKKGNDKARRMQKKAA